MTYELSIWLKRSGTCLRLCAAIRHVNSIDRDRAEEGSSAIFDTPGSFLSRFESTTTDPRRVEEIKMVVFHAIGTLNQVFTTTSVELRPEQLSMLGFTGVEKANSKLNGLDRR